jgi:formylglycine-generating enzyme required for sulfatase activity
VEKPRVISLDLPARLTLRSVPIRFVRIDPRTFSIRTSEGATLEFKVTRPFLVGTTEITQSEFEAVMRSNPSKIKSRTVQKRGGMSRMSPFQAVPNMIEQEEPLPLNPVENVTWAMAMEFCRKLEAKEKAMAKLPDSAVLRLPTEAEWWAAATGASAALGERFEWFSDKGKGHRALTADAKDDLVYDLFGNVAEWCVDAWSDALPPNGAVDFVTVVNSFPLAPAAEGAY